MADIKKLHKIIQEMGSDPNVSMHELVREVLKQDNDYSDYYLDNISGSDDKDLNADELESPPHHSDNILQVQARLENFLKEDQSPTKIETYDNESTTLETLEQLKTKAKNAWTQLVTATNSNSEVDE